METKHTPGPWAVGPWFDNDGQPEIIIEHVTPHGNLVPAVALGGLVGQEANAHLIAAAPDLLAVARMVIDTYPLVSSAGNSAELIKAARAAIAKATGATA